MILMGWAPSVSQGVAIGTKHCVRISPVLPSDHLCYCLLQEHNHRRAGSYGGTAKEKGEGIGSLAR